MSVPLEMMRVVSEMAAGSLTAAVWQGTLLAAAAGVGLKLLPKTPAGVRFAIWFAVFAAVVALPFFEFAHGGPAVAAAGHGAWLSLPVRWSFAIAALWLAASMWRGVSLAVGAVRVRALWKRAEPVDLPEAATLAGQGRRAQICVSDEIDRPSVIGFFAPKILIPGWLLEKMTPEEIAHVVLHEAGHLRRADDWLNLIQKLALVVFPLNPALVWIERRLCCERELACDERVLRATGAPKAYASCLAALAEHRMNRRSAALVMAALGRESDLGERVARILARGERMRPWQAGAVMGAAAVVLTAGAVGLEHSPELVSFGGQAESLAVPVSAASLRIAGPVSGLAGFAAQSVVFHADAAGRALPAKAAGLTVRGRAAAARAGVQGAAAVPVGARDAMPGTVQARMVVSGTDASAAMPRVVRTVAREAALGAGPTLVRAAAAPVAGADGQVGWVVMTAWKMADGSTVVMTSFAAPSVGTHDLVARPIAARECVGHEVDQDQRGMERVIVDGSEDGSPVVSPYAAAVPVRDGWLVVQL